MIRVKDILKVSSISIMAIGLLFTDSVCADSADKAAEQVELNYTIQAVNSETALRDLKSWAESQKGYLFSLTNTSISLIVPVSQSSDRSFQIDQIEKKIISQGVLLTKQTTRTDQSKRIDELKAAIGVKQKHLQDLQKLSSDSNLSETLTLEQELNRVQNELDQLKGEQRYLIETTRRIAIRVSLSRTTTSVADEPVYGWVNRLGVFEFAKEFDP